MNKIARTYTIVIIPERNGGRSYSLSVSRPVIIAGLVQAVIVVLVVGVMLSKSADVVRKIHSYYRLRSENEFLIKENNELRTVRQKIGRMDSLASYLERLAAPPGALETAPAKAGGNEAPPPGPDKPKPVTSREVAPELGGADPSDAAVPNVLPVEGWVTQQFNDDSSAGEKAHLGIDIAATQGATIKAPAAGTVIDVGVDKDYGNMFAIRHNGGFITRYGHCQTVFVMKNEKVERGQAIALVGSTGRSTAPHLHYEVLKDGKNRNPFDFAKTRKQ